MHDLNKQFAGLDIQQSFKTSGFLVPLKCLIRLLFLFCDSMVKRFYSNREVMNIIFSVRYIDWKIRNLCELLQINGLLPDCYSRINFSCPFITSEKMKERQLTDILNNKEWIESKFKVIEIMYKLPSDEFNLVWKIQGKYKIKI